MTLAEFKKFFEESTIRLSSWGMSKEPCVYPRSRTAGPAAVESQGKATMAIMRNKGIDQRDKMRVVQMWEKAVRQVAARQVDAGHDADGAADGGAGGPRGAVVVELEGKLRRNGGLWTTDEAGRCDVETPPIFLYLGCLAKGGAAGGGRGVEEIERCVGSAAAAPGWPRLLLVALRDARDAVAPL